MWQNVKVSEQVVKNNEWKRQNLQAAATDTNGRQFKIHTDGSIQKLRGKYLVF